MLKYRTVKGHRFYNPSQWEANPPKSVKHALRLSIKHWEQILNAPEESLRRAMDQSIVFGGTRDCPMCAFIESINKYSCGMTCPLSDESEGLKVCLGVFQDIQLPKKAHIKKLIKQIKWHYDNC